MTDEDALALCCFQEANLEPDDGLAAVAKVVLNRTNLKYQSKGTLQDTIWWPNAFSWTEWEMVNGKYTKVAFTPEEVSARAEDLLARSKLYATAWARAQKISSAVADGTYNGTDYDKLTDRTVLYLNPAIVAHLPSWADPAKLVCVIKHHEFFHS